MTSPRVVGPGRRAWTVAGLAVALILTGYLAWRTHDRRAAGRFREAALRRVPVTVVKTGTLPHKLRESSGVAASRVHPGVLWTHNDSGDDADLYAVDFSGNVLAEYEVDDARARDWEDIALGPCPGVGGDCLYIADTGDNQLRRARYRIYVVREPSVDSGAGAADVDIPLLGRTIFEYPGRVARDAEALAVAPDGEVLIVTKGRAGFVQLFSLGQLDFADEDARPTARLVTTLPIEPWWGIGRVVTGAAMSADGTRLAVRTYSEIFFFARAADGSLTPAGDACFVADLADGGEAVDFLGDSALVLTSERHHGHPGAIDVITCR